MAVRSRTLDRNGWSSRPRLTVVVVEDETVLGSAKMGPNRPGRGSHVATTSFMVETNTAAVHLWQTLGFEILATVPEAFHHPDHGNVGLHLMFLRLQ